MKVTIEPWTPFHESLCWMLSDAYFARCGLDAWRGGAVPHDATSNFGMATQHARFLVDHLTAHAPAEGELWVLEVGSGSGAFAANLLRALDTTCGERGRAIHARLRYVMSDYARKSVAEAAASNALRGHVAAGRVIPALLDLRRGGAPRTLDDAPLDARYDAVFANYVCCVIPQRSLQRRGSTWHEQLVQVVADVAPDHTGGDNPLEALFADPTREHLLESLELQLAWRERDLGSFLQSALHQRVVEHLLVGMEEATVGYPLGFIDFLLDLTERLRPHAFVSVMDYGKVERAELAGLRDRRPEIYGNSIAHETPFCVFDAFGEIAEWGVLRTRDPLRSVQTAVLAPGGGVAETLRESFERHHVMCRLGDDLIDFYDTASRAGAEDEHDRAVRYFRRCVDLDPYRAEYRYRLAEAAVDGGHYRLAIAAAEVGMALDDGEDHDFEFVLGRAFCLDDDFSEAIAWYERSLRKDEHWVTLTNLATLYEREGRFDDARRGYQRALELKPDYDKAKRRLAKLGDRIH
ncbi:MAG: tetratricopeptide repeat protein [Deltaproteobacteria bacterium]|nr:MAG: tetratricopeptide repeat protein [Deltaproteobacteria bacterium]